MANESGIYVLYVHRKRKLMPLHLVIQFSILRCNLHNSKMPKDLLVKEKASVAFYIFELSIILKVWHDKQITAAQ